MQACGSETLGASIGDYRPLTMPWQHRKGARLIPLHLSLVGTQAQSVGRGTGASAHHLAAFNLDDPARMGDLASMGRFPSALVEGSTIREMQQSTLERC